MMRKAKNKHLFYGLAVVILLVSIGAVIEVGKYVNEQNAARREAELWTVRYERVIPIYSAEEGDKVLELLSEQVDTNRINEAEENENICVWYSLTGKVCHKDVFDRFLRNVERGIEDAVIVVESDWEAHVNVHFISYRNGTFFYVGRSDWQYYGEDPVMREFPYGKVGQMSIRLCMTEDAAELGAWDEAWLKEQKDVNEAYSNKEISWEEYVDWKEERNERSKERPYVDVWVSE